MLGDGLACTLQFLAQIARSRLAGQLGIQQRQRLLVAGHAGLQVLRFELLAVQAFQTLAGAVSAGGCNLRQRAAAIRCKPAEIGQCRAVGLVHLACKLQGLATESLDDCQLRQRALLLVEHHQRTKRLLAIAGDCSGIAQWIAMWRRAARIGRRAQRLLLNIAIVVLRAGRFARLVLTTLPCLVSHVAHCTGGHHLENSHRCLLVDRARHDR